MGDLLKHFMFDGLGRLVRTQTPVTPGSTSLKTERFLYDGIRRIQEFVTNPVVTLGGASGDPVLETLAAESVTPGENPDQQTAPAPYEQGQLTLGGGGGGTVTGTVSREYVWGPGDNGFDELLVQYDQSGAEAWPIQDAGGDLVAMCDLNGDDGQGNVGFARVVGQWTFDAYGEVLTAEYLETFAYPHLGHKGLFLARLDGTTGSPRLVPFGHSLYQMRNRTYAPGLGRFLQRDPNATAMALVEAMAMHGRGLGTLSLAFDIESLYSDGGSLYEYLAGCPWNRSDALGLSWDPFDMVDEYLAEDAGSKAAFLDRVIGTAHTMAYLTASIAAWSPVPIVMIAAEAAMAVMGEPQTAFYLKLKGSAQAFEFLIGGMQFAAMDMAVHYAQQYGAVSLGPVVHSRLAQQATMIGVAGGMWELFKRPGTRPGNAKVYVGKIDDTIVYIGQSVDVARREVEHAGLRGKIFEVTEGMHPMQAKAIETAVIEEARANGIPMLNRIRSISPRWGWFGQAISWARDFLQRHPIHLR